MCFSAGASFGTGAVLAVVGVIAIKESLKGAVRPSDSKNSKRSLAFAAIPLVFSVQQISEGFLWLALTDPSYAWLQGASAYSFLFFAQFLWPLWIPLSVLLMQPKDKRRKIHYALLGTGVLVSAYLGYCLLTYEVNASIEWHHIHYQLDFPASIANYGAVLYLIATIVPPFFSSAKRMWWLSTAIFISYIITIIFYQDFVISVWCFFAAVISILVWYIVRLNTGRTN